MAAISTEAGIVDFVRAARADKSPFEIVAGGTRRAVGRPLDGLPQLDVSGLSGILISAAALLEVNPDPDEAQIRAALQGNLCRCGAHNRMLRAVRLAAQRMREAGQQVAPQGGAA